MEANKKKILVVDDEQDLCEILKFNLETEGYQADTANSGEEAISMDIASYDLFISLFIMLMYLFSFGCKDSAKFWKYKAFARIFIVS